MAQRTGQIARLQREIAGLNAQRRSLQEERPFIWSIEFAEIFFHRGSFDIIIGNPPYVRRENLSDPSGRLTPDEYVEALLEMVRLDFPKYSAKHDRFKKGRKPSRWSDLYVFFIFALSACLTRRVCMSSFAPIPGWTWVTAPGCRRSSCGRPLCIW